MTICLLAGTGAFAQQAKSTQNIKERPTVEQLAQQKTERMTERLKLTEAQAKQVYQINFNQIQSMQTQREQMRTARQAEAEKMKSILTTEQFMQWSQMQQGQQGGKRGQMHAKHQGNQNCKMSSDRGQKKNCNKPCPKEGKE